MRTDFWEQPLLSTSVRMDGWCEHLYEKRKLTQIMYNITIFVTIGAVMSNIDKLDLRIAEILQSDASLTNFAISEQFHVSEATIRRRRVRLEQARR